MSTKINEVKLQNSGNNEYEYAFEPVPLDKRKSGSSIFIVLSGYTISLSNFVMGASIGFKMSFMDAIWACFVANLFLGTIAVFLGVLAYRTGLSTSMLSRKAFGSRASSIFSILLALSAINWVGVNSDTFAKMIASTFTWWPIPTAITAVLVIALWGQSAIRGYKGIEIVSWLGVPAAILLTVVSVIAVAMKSNNFVDVMSYVPSEPMTFTKASAALIGGWIFGCIITPDCARFAKSSKTTIVAGYSAVMLGLFGLEVCGILVATATKQASFVGATAALGLGVLVFFCAIFCLWTTQDNNIYGASLAMQNVFDGTKLAGKVSHKMMAITVVICAASFAAIGALKYLLPVITFLSVLLPPVPGLIIGECFFVKNSKENKKWNYVALIAWFLGGLSGYWALKVNFFVSPIIGISATIIFYVILSKLLDAKLNKEVL